MVVLDATVMNIALPSAQPALHFNDVDRQWIVTAYSLSFGSLLLFGGRLADLVGRRVMFITGLAGFALASAIGGASVNFAMLVTARACQGVFGAMLAPAALSLLATTFTDPKERGKAFGVYGSVAAGGGAVGLLLGGALTSYLSWRWCLYINLFFAGCGDRGRGGLPARPAGPRPAELDIPGVLLVSSGVFCLVYGFSNAATHGWGTPSTYGFLAVAVVLLGLFAFWKGRAKPPAAAAAGRPRPQPGRRLPRHPDRRRGHVRRLPVRHLLPAGHAALLAGDHRGGVPADGRVHRDLRRTCPTSCCCPGSAPSRSSRPACSWPRSAGAVHPDRRALDYAGTVLPALMVTGLGLGLMFSTAFNTGTYGVAPRDAGVASATVNTGQQLGGSIGTSLLNTIFASAMTAYLASHLVPHSCPVRGRRRSPRALPSTGTSSRSGGSRGSSCSARSSAAP